MRLSTAALVTSGAVLGGVSAATAWGSASKASQLFGPSIYRGPGRRKSIALTFDDGPSEATEQLLEFLDRENIKATFFMCGMNVRRLPQIAGKVAAAGHELGNHTYSHPSLLFKSREFIDREFTDAQKIIHTEIGIAPMMLRPPYGLRWPGMFAVQQKLSLLTVLWTVIGNDWKLSADRISERILRYAAPGGIVCLHDGRAVEQTPNIAETVQAVRKLVPILRDRGYFFETVSDLLD